MKVLSAHLWEKEEVLHMPISLVLQQACVGKKTIVLACVCEGKNPGETGVTESGYFTEGLTEWFHREGVRLCEKREVDRAVNGLKEDIRRLKKENREYTARKNLESKLYYWGIFMVEDRAWIFAWGGCKGFLLNRRFQKKNMREISVSQQDGKENWIEVKIQKRVGILLCTESLVNGWVLSQGAEVLLPDGEVTEARMEKRLLELWKEQVRANRGKTVGAIYLRT